MHRIPKNVGKFVFCHGITYSRLLQDKDLGIQILVVAVGNWLNELEIRSIASYPAEKNVFQVKNFASIGTVKSELKQAICNGMHNKWIIIFIPSICHM